jgi:hypothetical protein
MAWHRFLITIAWIALIVALFLLIDFPDSGQRVSSLDNGQITADA